MKHRLASVQIVGVVLFHPSQDVGEVADALLNLRIGGLGCRMHPRASPKQPAQKRGYRDRVQAQQTSLELHGIEAIYPGTGKLGLVYQHAFCTLSG